MDYLTRPITRKELRTLAKWVRHVFKCKNKLRFDVIEAFEHLPNLYSNVRCEIVEDGDFSEIGKGIPSACIPDFNGNYRILVRNNVYDGACNGIGGYRAHIVHEISHYFLCEFGYMPVLGRSYGNGEIWPCYRSMEWQAKALAGEILVPYEETKRMSVKQIKFYCKVSQDCAERRLRLD